MAELKQWIWPAAAGAMGMIVAFGAGVSVGDRWVSIGIGSKQQSQPSAMVDSSDLRPIVHEEVQRGVADAMAARRETVVAETPVPAPVHRESKPVAATSSSATKRESKRSESQAASSSYAARAAALVTMIRTLRSQMAQYRTDHVDRYPTFAQLQNNWAAFTQATNTDGSLAGGTRGVLGPYLQSPPINPLTNTSEVAPAGMPTSTCGWTYDEKTGRIRAFVPAGNPGGDLVADAYVERGGRHIIQTASMAPER